MSDDDDTPVAVPQRGVIDGPLGLKWRYTRMGPCMGCDDEWAPLRRPLDTASLRTVSPPELCPRCMKRYEGTGKPPLGGS